MCASDSARYPFTRTRSSYDRQRQSLWDDRSDGKPWVRTFDLGDVVLRLSCSVPKRSLQSLAHGGACSAAQQCRPPSDPINRPPFVAYSLGVARQIAAAIDSVGPCGHCVVLRSTPGHDQSMCIHACACACARPRQRPTGGERERRCGLRRSRCTHGRSGAVVQFHILTSCDGPALDCPQTSGRSSPSHTRRRLPPIHSIPRLPLLWPRGAASV